MDNIKSLSEKINNKIGDKRYFYISNEVEHGIGLSEFIDNFTHVCLNYTDVVDYLDEDGRKIYCAVRENFDKDIRSSAELLEMSNVKCQMSNGDFVQTFKISSKFGKLSENYQLNLMNTSSELNRLFEGKINQSKLFKEAGLDLPKFKIGVLGNLSYVELIEKFDGKFVIQFDRGHTGSGTFFISNRDQWSELVKKFPNREVKISEFVRGETYSINCCMTKYGVYVGGIYKQITGVSELTSEAGGTVGGTFVHGLDNNQLLQINAQLVNVKRLLRQQGYKGLFGLDFIVNSDGIVIIEMNARQQMTVAFNSRLNIIREQIPINLIHIAEFMDLEYEIDLNEYNRISLESFEAGQLYLRNKSNNKISLGTGCPNSGEYEINKKLFGVFQSSKFVEKNYLVDKIKGDNLILLSQSLGSVIKPNGEVLRIQILGDLFKEGKLNYEYVDFLESHFAPIIVN